MGPVSRVYYGWWVVLTCSAVGFFSLGLSGYGFSVFLKPIAQELALSRTSLSLVFSVSRLQGALEGPIVGWLVDRFGPRVIMAIGVLMAGLGYVLLAGVVHSYVGLLLVYTLLASLGVQVGFQHPAFAAVNAWFIRRKAQAVAIVNAASSLGGAVLVPLLGITVAAFSWRQAALAGGLALWVILLPLTLLVRRSPESMGLLPDGDRPRAGAEQSPGAASGHTPDGGNAKGAQHAVSSRGLADFLVKEAIQTPTFWILTAAVTLRNFAHGAIILHMVPIMTDRGMTPVQAASAVGVLALVAIWGKLFAGWLGDRFSKRHIMPTLLGVETIGLFVLLVAQETWQLYLFAVVYPLGYGIGTLSVAMMGDYYGRHRFATIRGIHGAVQAIGGVAGPVFAGLVYDTTGSYSVAIMTYMVLYGIAAALFLNCRSPRMPARLLEAPTT